MRIAIVVVLVTGLLSSSALAQNAVMRLRWAASTDPDVTVQSYNIYRDGVKVGSIAAADACHGSRRGCIYTEGGPNASTQYSYRVTAVNSSGVESDPSIAVNATTLSGARRFYIDFAAGSNSNAGTSKAAPWKSHPYMQTGSGCTGGTTGWGGYSHQAGDHFVFKGGVSWPAACFTMTIGAGGSSGAHDYYGADPTWFSGASFTRPVFDLNYSVPTDNMVISGNGRSYIDFDNLEIAHQGITGSVGPSCSSGGTAYERQAAFQFPNSSGVTITNSYIHDWVTTHAGNAYNFLNYSAGSVSGVDIVDHSEISGENSWFGSGHTPVTFGGGCQNCGEVRFSKIHHGMAACFSVQNCHDNEFYAITTGHNSLDPCPHSQVIEDNGNEVDIVYNNLVHDNAPVGVTLYQCDASSVYNNVFWNNANVQIMLSGCSGQGGSAVANVYNNIVDCSNGTACFGTDAKGTLPGTVNLKNNLWITNGRPTFYPSSISHLVQSNNTTISARTANAQGYTSANKYKGSGSTAGAGANLTSSCSGSLTLLCKTIEGVSKPTSGAWNIGPY